MIVGLSIYIAAVAAQTTGDPSPDQWAAGMAGSKIARESPYVRRLIKALTPPKQTANVPDPSLSLYTPPAPSANGQTPYTAARIERHKRSEAALAEVRRAQEASKQGNYAEARRILEAEILQPGAGGWCVVPLMDVDFAMGDYAAAYKTAVPFVGGTVEQSFLIRASLAASAMGEVYPGQREYCMKIIHREDPNNQFGGPYLSFPGDSAQNLAVISHLLVGDELAGYQRFPEAALHLEQVLKSDPGNPVFCYGLADCYAQMYQYSRAIDLLKQGLPRSGTGQVHLVFGVEMANYKSELETVGDGHPMVAPPPPTPLKDPKTIHPE